MSYIGRKPTPAALTSSDIAADVITAAKIADDAISEEHLDATAITGFTALGAVPADTDELLVSDAGTLKRMDYSYIKGNPSLLYSAASTTDVGSLDVSSTYITSTHRWYKIYLSGKMANDGVSLIARYMIDGSAVTDNYAMKTAAFGGSDYDNSTGQNTIDLTNQVTIGNAANEPFSAVLDFFNPTSTTLTSILHWSVAYASTGDVFYGDLGVARRNDGTQAHNGITFYPSGGNFNEYAIAVYGFKV